MHKLKSRKGGDAVLTLYPYDRQAAVRYASRWAYGRNPAYADFDALGGDCTNFASQCLYAGAGVMDFTPTFGWYYRSLRDRAPAWTGVETSIPRWAMARIISGDRFRLSNRTPCVYSICIPLFH